MLMMEYCTANRTSRLHFIKAETGRNVFQQFGLELNKEKTRIVYCKDNRRPQNYSCTQFTFLGYTFRPRLNKNKEGKFFVALRLRSVKKPKTAMKQKIREWKIQLKGGSLIKKILGT